MSTHSNAHYLFGGDNSWSSDDWTASDDRVRGGKSQSYIQCSSHTATFSGTLDIKTLGGAGFASQRTTGEERHWDLTDYDGITLEIAAGDSKRYTFILKDELLPRNPENDREQASLSYEFDFYVNDALRSSGGDSFVFIPWKALKATYRGREREDATPIDLSHVKRVSIMNRSFFGEQEGDFSLSLKSIKATIIPSMVKGDLDDSDSDTDSLDKPSQNPKTPQLLWLQQWLSRCFTSRS